MNPDYPCTDCGAPCRGLRCNGCRNPQQKPRRHVFGDALLIVLPYPPDVGNARGHWRTRDTAKNRYWDACDNRQLMAFAPRPPAEPWQRVRMRAVLYGWNMLDEDNAMARLKHSVDWLRSRGYLMEDRKKNIEWDGLPVQHIDRSNQRLELYVEPLTD